MRIEKVDVAMTRRLWRAVGVVGEEMMRHREEMQEGLREGVARESARSSQRTLASHDKYFQLFTEVGVDGAALGEQCSSHELPAVQGNEEDQSGCSFGTPQRSQEKPRRKTGEMAIRSRTSTVWFLW